MKIRMKYINYILIFMVYSKKYIFRFIKNLFFIYMFKTVFNTGKLHILSILSILPNF